MRCLVEESALPRSAFLLSFYAVMNCKFAIYIIFRAQQDGRDLKKFISGHIKQADAAIQNAREAGLKRPPMLLNQLKRHFDHAGATETCAV